MGVTPRLAPAETVAGAVIREDEVLLPRDDVILIMLLLELPEGIVIAVIPYGPHTPLYATWQRSENQQRKVKINLRDTYGRLLSLHY